MRDLHKDRAALNLPWVFSPFFESLLESASLGEAERELARHFRDEGYASLDTPVTDPDTMRRAIADLEGRYDAPATGSEVPSTRLDAWRWSEAVIEIARAPLSIGPPKGCFLPGSSSRGLPDERLLGGPYPGATPPAERPPD